MYYLYLLLVVSVTQAAYCWMVRNQWIMSCQGWGWKQLWPSLMDCINTLLEGHKMPKTLSQHTCPTRDVN